MSYYLRLPLVLDIMKICIDFGPYDAFLSSDITEMTKLVKLVTNRQLSYIFYIKCRYVGGSYMYFITVNSANFGGGELCVEEERM
jgi:hypothetical protein